MGWYQTVTVRKKVPISVHTPILPKFIWIYANMGLTVFVKISIKLEILVEFK